MNRTTGWLITVACVALAACSGSSDTSTPTSAVPATDAPTTTTAAAKGPATAEVTFAGDAPLAGAWVHPEIACNVPTLGAPPLIRVQAQSSGDPSVAIVVTATTDKVTVIAASGSGASYTSRTFEGTGIFSFDAATGAQIDSPLTEITAAGTTTGTIGVVTSISGSIDCGNQTVGTSTVQFTGETQEGSIAAGPDPFRVECVTSAQGNSVSLVGSIFVAGQEGYFFTTFSADSVNLFETFRGPPSVLHQYLAKGAGVNTLTGTGAHVAVDLVEQSPTSGVAHTLHIEGDVACGTTVAR